MKLEPRHQRPIRLLNAVGEMFPGCWDRLALMRAEKGRPPLPDWPAWCYLPIAAGLAEATRGAPLETIAPAERLSSAQLGAPLVGLAAWRIAKGIWDFDLALLESLRRTPLDGELPIEALYRLPEWCPYICLPESETRPLGAGRVHGAFVWLESDVHDGRPELRFLLDVDGTPGERPPLISLVIHLTKPTLDECLTEARHEALRQLGSVVPWGSPVFSAQAQQGSIASEANRRIIAEILPLVLYLCSSQPDLTRPLPPRPGSGRKLSPAPQQQPTVWPVGIRIGAAIREYERTEREAGPPTGRVVRPHMRMAHWHHYWVGAGRAELALRWVAPVAVGAGEMPGVVRRVSAPDEAQ